MTTVVLAGSLDTKGEEYRFARNRLRRLRAGTVIVDTGVMCAPAFRPDVCAAEVAAAAGTDLTILRKMGSRAAARRIRTVGQVAGNR